MATLDRFAESEHSDERPARSAELAWVRNPVMYFALAVEGMIIVFIGLGVDAYRHNHSAEVETLLSFGNPGHLIAAIGLALTSIAALAGLSVALLKDAKTSHEALRRFVPVTVAWVVTAAIAVGSITYVGASGTTIGHSHSSTESAVTDTHAHTSDAADAGGVVQGLQSQGIDPSGGGSASGGDGGSNPDPASVPGALTQGSNGHAGGQHDHGKQPTFAQIESTPEDQLLPQFPADTMTAEDFPLFKQQVEAVRKVAEQFKTPADAVAAGYVRTTSDVPYMGEHYLNYDIVRKGVFDPAHPSGLLYSKIDSGEEKLVGVWFLLLPGVGGVTRDQEPAGFAGNLDLWHAHTGLCLVGFSGASEGETKESCSAKGGSFTADLRWMMHVWVAPIQDNPDGVFAYLNNDLFQKQQAAAKGSSAPSGNITQ